MQTEPFSAEADKITRRIAKDCAALVNLGVLSLNQGRVFPIILGSMLDSNFPEMDDDDADPPEEPSL